MHPARGEASGAALNRAYAHEELQRQLLHAAEAHEEVGHCLGILSEQLKNNQQSDDCEQGTQQPEGAQAPARRVEIVQAAQVDLAQPCQRDEAVGVALRRALLVLRRDGQQKGR